ncbi:MAG: FG-GAP-like repeat-containing protein, partial [Candidatus Hodarchaeota archaeon]
MKQILFFKLILFFSFFATNLFSVQVEPELKVFYQPDGKNFQGRILGDEFVIFYETEDGYSIEKNDQGFWCYAKIGSNGRLEASEFIVGETKPNIYIGRKHLRHDLKIMTNIQSKRKEFYESLQLFEPLKALKGNAQDEYNLTPSSPISYNLAVLLIEFPDTPRTYAPEEFFQLLFSEGFTYVSPAPGEEAFGSLRDYYNIVSNEQFFITGEVFAWVLSDHNKSFYESSDSFIYEAVTKSGVDLNAFNGYVVIYAGSVGLASGKLWPRTEVTGGTLHYIMPEKWLQKYDFTPIGVHCHEFGHLLGLPDLYDTDFSSPGIGVWGLMGSGNYGNGHHERPFHLSIWSKIYLGWISPTTIYDNDLTRLSLGPVEISGEVIKLISFESFFLVENRQQIGYDLNLPGSGLLIWHIDERFGQQNFERHRIVDLEEADGEEDRGDAGDPFPGITSNTIFNATSNPSSQDYDGKSYAEVSNIQMQGEMILFEASTDLGTGVGITVNHKGNFPNLFTALESANSGDTVFVPEGTYVASNLFVKENRVLKGKNPVETILDGLGNKILLLIDVQNATIRDFTFTNTQTAISLKGSGGSISYNIFRDLDGNAITCTNSSPMIRNNTIVNGTNTGINCFVGSMPTIENNIIVYNAMGITSSTNSFPKIIYNDVWNNGVDYLGIDRSPNDISIDPLFVNSFFGDYHLQPNSPCINAGDPDPELNDEDGTRNDMGALPFDINYIFSIEGIRVNAGGQAYIDEDSTFWAQDQPYVEGSWGYEGGEMGSTFDPIANTNNDPLYQTERHAVDAYVFDLPNDRYCVTLHFCEIVWQQINQRIFDVEIESRHVIRAFDIYSQSGHDHAKCLYFFIDVRDGQLNIQFSAHIGITQICAIEVAAARPQLIEVADFAKVAHPANSQGIAIGDYDNDDYHDIFIANEGRINTLFRNNGLGLFINATLESEFLLSGGGKMGIWGDYNNDGDLDLYVVRTASPNILYRNNGNYTFTDITENAGVGDRGMGVACAWGDYDNDGYLDLYVANKGLDVLYRNRGDGTFINITDSVGLKNMDSSSDAIWGDINNDGFLDLVVTHNGNLIPIPNLLYINNQDGTFRAIELDNNGLGATFGDYDNDADIDIFMIINSTFVGTTQNRLFRNDGKGIFSDVAASAGVASDGSAIGAGWIDLDNDRYLDLFLLREEQPDILFHNNRDGTFTNIADSAGLEDHDLERSFALGDFDNDGDQDIYVARFGKENLLYQNQGNENNWLTVKTQGTNSNKA